MILKWENEDIYFRYWLFLRALRAFKFMVLTRSPTEHRPLKIHLTQSRHGDLSSKTNSKDIEATRHSHELNNTQHLTKLKPNSLRTKWNFSSVLENKWKSGFKKFNLPQRVEDYFYRLIRWKRCKLLIVFLLLEGKLLGLWYSTYSIRLLLLCWGLCCGQSMLFYILMSLSRRVVILTQVSYSLYSQSTYFLFKI